MENLKDTAAEAYHSAPYQAVATAIQSFAPINAVGQQLCGLHIYAHDPTRHVQAHHFCTHLNEDMHQCIIYDSDKKDARLIGIEYVISERKFADLPMEERKYWHSHKYEVESGMLQLGTKALVPNKMTDVAEIPAFTFLQSTYGKTIHTWQIDKYDFPLGPPQLMMAYTDDSQVPEGLLAERDAKYGFDSQAKKAARAGYLPQSQLDKQPLQGADPWTSGKSMQLEFKDVDVVTHEQSGKRIE